MTIPSQHIHNVLKAYRHRLSRKNSPLGDGPPEKNPISARWKRKAVVEKVIREMADKLTRFGIDALKTNRSNGIPRRNSEEIDEPEKKDEMNLIYHVINHDNKKCIREISSGDFSSLFNSPHQADPFEK